MIEWRKVSPIAILLFFGFLGWVWFRHLRYYYLFLRRRRWPQAEAEVQRSGVAVVLDGGRMFHGSHVAYFSYLFQVDGFPYVGFLAGAHTSEDGAISWAQSGLKKEDSCPLQPLQPVHLASR